MADDMNNSNRGPMNSKVEPDYVDMSAQLTELEKIGQGFLGGKTHERLKQEQRYQEKYEQRKLLLKAAREKRDVLASPDYVDALQQLRKETHGLKKQMNSSDAASMSRAESIAATYVGRQFSGPAVRAQASTMNGDTGVQSQAYNYINLTDEQIEEQRGEIMSNIRQRGRAARKKTKGLYNAAGDLVGHGPLNEEFLDKDKDIQSLAALDVAANIKKSRGIDDKSKLRSFEKIGQGARDLLADNQMRQEVNTGKVKISTGDIGVGDIGSEIVKKSTTLVEALDKLEKKTFAVGESFSSVKESAKIAAEDIGKLKEAQAASGGGGKVGGISSRGWGVIGALGQIGNIVGGGIMAAGVDHRIADRGNIANMAGLENSKYAMYKAARHGDVASQLAMSQWGAAQRFGFQVKTTSQVAEAAQVGGNVLMGAAKTAGATALATLAGGAAATGVGIPVAALLASGAVGLGVSAATDFGVGASSLGRGIKSGQNYVAGVSSDMEARRQINAVPAEQMQGLRDFYVGAGTVSMGMGARGEGFLKQMTDAGDSADVRMMKARNGDTVNKGMLENMADAGISPEQMIQMADLGNKALGSQFTPNQVFAGRRWEKAGLGTMQENMQRMGQLSNVGSNNPQTGLETIMATAMTKGLDSSKALSMMVDNTAALVGASAVGGVGGIDTSNVVAAQLASFVDKGSATAEFDLARAKTATDIARASDTNVSTTFSGMMNTSRISAITGLEGVEALTAGETDVSQWKKMQEMAKEGPDGLKKAGEFARARGMNIKNESILDVSTKMIDLKQRQIAEGSGTANAIAGGITDEMFAALKGDDLKEGDKNYAVLAQIASRTKYKTVQEYQKAVRSGDISSDPNAVIPPASGDGKTLQEQMDALRTGGFTQLSEAAQSAATALKDIGGAVKIFTDLNEKYKKDGPATEKEMSTAAGKAADKFELGADKFGGQVTRLEGILNNVIAKSGMYVPPVVDDKTEKTSGAR